VNANSLREIHEEIATFQTAHEDSRESAFIEWFVRLPGFLRRTFLRILFRSPRLIKDLYGTVLVSNVGMFGKGSGWGIPVPNHSLQLTLGVVADKPGAVERRVEIRQYLSLTVSFDHAVVDGAPVARSLRERGSPEIRGTIVNFVRLIGVWNIDAGNDPESCRLCRGPTQGTAYRWATLGGQSHHPHCPCHHRC
jgi:hypothetical protein